MTDAGKGAAKARLMREAAKMGAMVAVLVVLMLWLSGAFFSKVEPQPPREKRDARPVRTAKVERRHLPLAVEQVGTLRARMEAQVSSRILAQVKAIRVAEGDQVFGPEAPGHQGTVLALLDDADLLAKLKQALAQAAGIDKAIAAARAQTDSARAGRDRARLEFQRTDALRRDQAATGQQWEAARAQRDITESQLRAASHDVARLEAQRAQAESAVAEAQSFLDHAVIRAPFTGKVLRKTVDVGDMAAPGQVLFHLDTPGHPELHADLSESLLPQVREGMVLEVRIDALERSVSGRLREIVPQSDPGSRTVRIKIELDPEAGMVNGLFGRVRIPYGSYEALVVPAPAVRQLGQLQLVDVVGADGHPIRRFVTVGEGQAGVVEVLSGLDAGEEVVLP